MPPIIGMIRDFKNKRYHPVLFLCYPTPSGMKRYKSKGHHTVGFDSREEAVEFCKGDMTEHCKTYGDPVYCLEKDFPWNGEEIPAIVGYFSDPDEENNCKLMI